MENQSGTFNPIGNSDNRMHGKTSLLVSGFSVSDQGLLRKLLKEHALSHIPVVFVNVDFSKTTLTELSSFLDGHGEGLPSSLRRGIVMSGLTEVELHRLMESYRKSGMGQQHWASVTAISENWSIAYLLNELTLEQNALKDAISKKKV